MIWLGEREVKKEKDVIIIVDNAELMNHEVTEDAGDASSFGA